MSKRNVSLGRWGESVAATHLESKGYTIVTRNWRCVQGEVDLVAERGGALAFVEVKTRKGKGVGTPESAITPRKGQRMLAVALAYLFEHDLPEESDWSVDVIAVALAADGTVQRIEHWPSAVGGW